MKRTLCAISLALCAATGVYADEGKYQTLMLSGVLLVQTDTETGQLRICHVDPELVTTAQPVELTAPKCGQWSAPS